MNYTKGYRALNLDSGANRGEAIMEEVCAMGLVVLLVVAALVIYFAK